MLPILSTLSNSTSLTTNSISISEDDITKLTSMILQLAQSDEVDHSFTSKLPYLHRIFFSIPFNQSTTLPITSHSYSHEYYLTKPLLFQQPTNVIFNDQQILDDVIRERVSSSNPTVYCDIMESLLQSIPLDNNTNQFDDYQTNLEFIKVTLEPIVKLVSWINNVLGNVKYRSFVQTSPITKRINNITINTIGINDSPMIVCKIGNFQLQRFTFIKNKWNHITPQIDSQLSMDFHSLIQRLVIDMINSNCSNGIISDLDTCYHLSIDFDHKIWKNRYNSLKHFKDSSIDGLTILEYLEIPFIFNLISSKDTGITIQSFIASTLHRLINQQVVNHDSIFQMLRIELERSDLEFVEEKINKVEEMVLLDEILNPDQYSSINIKNHTRELLFSNLSSMTEFNPNFIQFGFQHRSQIIEFTKSSISSIFPDLSNSLTNLNSNETIIMKLYDFDYLHQFYQLQRNDYYYHSTYHEFLHGNCFKSFHNEIHSLNKIMQHNKQYPNNTINSPNLYNFGKVILFKQNRYILGGLFILMEKLTGKDLSKIDRSQLCRFKQTIQKSGHDQLKLLNSLKVWHNDVSLKNLTMDALGNLGIIDFSHSIIDEDVESDEDLKNFDQLISRFDEDS